MSKDNPEVGDVWKRGNYKYYIHDITIMVDCSFINYINNNLVVDYKPLSEFLEQWKYVGKAKGSISDLFEVKE